MKFGLPFLKPSISFEVGEQDRLGDFEFDQKVAAKNDQPKTPFIGTIQFKSVSAQVDQTGSDQPSKKPQDLFKTFEDFSESTYSKISDTDKFLKPIRTDLIGSTKGLWKDYVMAEPPKPKDPKKEEEKFKNQWLRGKHQEIAASVREAEQAADTKLVNSLAEGSTGIDEATRNKLLHYQSSLRVKFNPYMASQLRQAQKDQEKASKKQSEAPAGKIPGKGSYQVDFNMNNQESQYQVGRLSG